MEPAKKPIDLLNEILALLELDYGQAMPDYEETVDETDLEDKLAAILAQG